jgi:hypothetical protein
MAKSRGFAFAQYPNMKSIFVVLLPVFGIVAACGGSVVDGVNGGGDGGGSDGGSTGNDGGLETVGCPASLPNDGVACTPEGAFCEYGTNNGACGDPTTTCTGGVWKQPLPTPGVACLPSDSCPASHASIVDGQNCGNEELECNYPGQGRCTCATQGFGGLPVYVDGGTPPNVWECEQPTPGCPVDRPRIGSACSTENQSCTYGDCSMPDTVDIECSGGVWINEPFACAG